MKEVATFGAGCFWCTEAVFQNLKGVSQVTSGYAGGTLEHPTYQQVSNGNTGHAEVAQIEFDPTVISFKQLLEVFFVTHNPTTINRQGNDVGSQYRSVIFYHSDEQKKVAEAVKKQFEDDRIYDQQIVTAILPEAPFYPAEEYHRDYYNRNGGEPYCQAIIDPKISKLRQKFATLLKDS